VIMFGSIGMAPLSIAMTGALVRWTMQWTFSIFGAAMVLLAIGTGASVYFGGWSDRSP
jgi:hypothetical protein